MDFITIPVTFGIVSFFIYKFFELLICRKERLTIVDKIDGNSLIEYLKQVRMGLGLNRLSSESLRFNYPASWSLRIGCLIFGMGAGLILGTFMDRCLNYNAQYWSNSREIVFGGSMMCLGGLGLLAAFIVEYSLYRKACKEGK